MGHKCDGPGREVTEEEGKKMAEEYNIGFFESSARTNTNVSEVFYYLVKKIFIEKGIIKDESAIKLSNINSKDKKNNVQSKKIFINLKVNNLNKFKNY